jgi:hypothetical protein
MSKQTAIDFLIEELGEYFPHEIGGIHLMVEKAKEMEKQQLEQFYNHGQWAIIEHGHGESFEDYYNKSFNK